MKKLVGKNNTVIATGGGTALSEENRKLFGQMGLLIHLYVPLDVALSRAKRRQERPLLAKDTDQLEQLWTERLKFYNQAHITIDTSDKDITSIVEEISVLVKGGTEHASEN